MEKTDSVLSEDAKNSVFGAAVGEQEQERSEGFLVRGVSAQSKSSTSGDDSSAPLSSVAALRARNRLLTPATTSAAGGPGSYQPPDQHRRKAETGAADHAEQLLESVQDVKSIAKTMATTIKKGDTTIDNIGGAQEKGQADVDVQTKKATDLLSSSRMGIVQSIILLIASVIIFNLMVMFIFATKIINPR